MEIKCIKIKLYLLSHLQASENCQKLLAVIPLDFLRLLAAVQQLVVENVGGFFLLRQPFEARMGRQVLRHPLVQILHVRHRVEKTLQGDETLFTFASSDQAQLTPFPNT